MNRRVLEVIIKVKDQASGKLQSVGGNVRGITEKLGGLSVKAVAVSAAVVYSIKKMADGFKSLLDGVAKVGDSFDKMSLRTGVSVDELARWVYISKLAGGSASTVETSFKKLTKSMYDYSRGLSTAVEAFDSLGIQVLDSNGNIRESVDVMMDLATATARSTNKTELMGKMQDILGRGSLQMLAILEQGVPALSAQADEYDRLHGAMDRTAEAGARWTDAMLRLETVGAGLRERTITPLLEAITPHIEKFARVTGAVSNWKEGLQAAGYYLGVLTEDVIDFAKEVDKSPGVMETFFPPEMFGPGGTIQKQASELDKIDKALKSIASAPVIERDNSAADYDGYKDTLGLIEDIIQAEEERAARLSGSHEAEAEALMREQELLIAAGEAADEHIAKLQESSSSIIDLGDAADSAADNFERLSSNAINAFLNGEKGALKFGRILKTTVMNAISAVIAKLLRLGAMKIFGMIFTGGASAVTPFAAGGTIPRAAYGYAVPDGPRGMDSRLIAAMPGEEVVSRSLSQRLASFLASQESASMVSPFSLASSGRSVVVSMNIARPVGYLDLLDLGESAAVAARKVAGANL